MPVMANITVKAANGTTDVVYNALTPSSGDKTAARWRVEAASTYAAQKPALSLVSQDNGPKTARKVTMMFKYPVVETINGLPTIIGYIPFEITGTIPLQVPDSGIAEGVHQVGNLLCSALIRDCFKTGYSAS